MINKTNKSNKTEVEILPLLSANEANELANSLTEEMELQLVADKIRMAVNGTTSFKYKLELVDIIYCQYIYDELIKAGYNVIFKGPKELIIIWEKV